MDQQKKDSMLIEEIKEKLDWYISEASDEEYSEKEVEFLQRLLDTLEPMEEGAMPDVDEAWERFWVMAEEKDKNGELFGEEDGVDVVKVGSINGTNAKDTNTRIGNAGRKKKNKRIFSFVARHKAIVAAMLLVLVLAVSAGVQTEAVRNSGFFHWLKNDETGMQMVTSPDGLDGVTENAEKKVYYDREEVPDWAEEWAEIEKETMKDEKCDWKYFELEEYQSRKIASSCYEFEGDTIILGKLYYAKEILVSTEVFGDYSFVGDFDAGYGQISIYKKEEEWGEISYIVTFYRDSSRYYIIGKDLWKVQQIATQYQVNLQNYGELGLKWE